MASVERACCITPMPCAFFSFAHKSLFIGFKCISGHFLHVIDDCFMLEPVRGFYL